MAEPIFFATASEWRNWLADNHDTATECVVGYVKVASGTPGLRWSESVDEALCFGWIDGVRRGLDDTTYSIRFTPRKPGSSWSRVNIAKVEQLRAAGRMTEAGERAFAARSETNTAVYSYEREPTELGEAESRRFSRNRKAKSFFDAQAQWYRRSAIHWVMSAKREETRGRRLEQLISDSAAGRRLRHLSRDRRQ
jgi:uncharacterized protein YdeI (YjbR/CyaY-like superfamily)